MVILGGGGHLMFRSPILQGPKMGGNLLVPRILYCTVCADGVLIIRLNSLYAERKMRFNSEICWPGGGHESVYGRRRPGVSGVSLGHAKDVFRGMPRVSLEACQGCL